LTTSSFSILMKDCGKFFSCNRYCTQCCLTHSSGCNITNLLRMVSNMEILFSLFLKRNENFGKLSSCKGNWFVKSKVNLRIVKFQYSNPKFQSRGYILEFGT